MNTHDKVELPPLPPGYKSYEFPDGGYDEDDMRTYARAAIEADRKQRSNTKPSTNQDWLSLDPAVAFHLIERHAENWNDAGAMMQAYLDAHIEADRKRIAELESANAELERLCDETYVAQGADAYNLACEEMEDWQAERRKAGKEVGTTGSLCDGIQWLYGYIEELEADRKRRGEPVAWLYEDELPDNYPYDTMFPYSKVDGGVRMFPVYAPQPAEPVHETARTAGNGAEIGMNTGPQGGAHSASSYSGCGCNSDDCRVNGCLSKRQAQSAMAPGGGGMPAEPVKVPSMIDLIADDAYAATFQSIGQYRKALLARYGNQTQEQP